MLYSTVSCLEACFAKESGIITWDEYIYVFLARCTGVSDKMDDSQPLHIELREADPFGHSLFCWTKLVGQVRGKPYAVAWICTSSLMESIDIRPFEAVFKAYRYSTVEDVKDCLSKLDAAHAKGLRSPLGILALQERRADVLNFCLEQGMPFGPYFQEEADRVDSKTDPETFAVLERLYRPRMLKRSVKSKAEDDWGMKAAAAFDVGGSHPVDW
jgi:hypothetical protein